MKQPHMTQAPTTSATPIHLIYGRPPLGLADVLSSAVQVSPLIPGSPAIEEIADVSADSAVVLAPPGTAERDYVIAQMLRVLKPGGELTVMALKDKGGSRLRKSLEAFGCDVDETSKAHHRIAFGGGHHRGEFRRGGRACGDAESVLPVDGAESRILLFDGIIRFPGHLREGSR